MNEILTLLQEQSVIIFGTFIVNKWLKGRTWFDNSFIPVFTLLASYLGYTLAPTSAHAAGLLSPLAPAAGAGAMAILQTVLITGTHSLSKNTLIPLLKLGLRAAALSILKEKN